jgi:hypothetical protein
VSGALDRLTCEVRNFPPVLARWDQPGNERLKLIVRHEWLALPRYGRVPLPLPTSGPVVLALHLFLAVIDPRPRGATSIAAKALYERLGIRTARPAHDERALRHALACVNEHRRKQGLSAFELSGDGKGGWRFTARPHQPVRSNYKKRKPSAAPSRRSIPKSIRASRWDDERARLNADKEDRDEFRRSLALADDEWLDDDEIDRLRSRQEAQRRNDQRRVNEDQDREMFRGFNERLRGSGWGQ